MNYIFDLEDRLRMALTILTSMGFDVNLIGSITYNATGDMVTFYYKDDTVWQVDLEDKKQRYMGNGAWTDWVYM